ncbi:DUF397 domain-containing protein [Actinoallomurus sp. NPDC052274]
MSALTRWRRSTYSTQGDSQCVEVTVWLDHKATS